MLDETTPQGEGFDGDVARRAPRDVLLLSALLHDIGKGSPGDHSVIGVEIAASVASRIGLPDAATDSVTWLVRNHLLLADTATRRDLSDERTIARFAAEVGDVPTLDALYALTIGDSRATGPSAWSSSKAGLVRELYVKAAGWIVEGAVVTADAATELLERTAEVRSVRATAVEWFDLDDDLLELVVVAPDATGMLARVAGALALHGFDVVDAAAVTDDDGMAVERFRGRDRFGRLEGSGRDDATRMLTDALAGDAAFDVQLRERARRYRHPVNRSDARDVQRRHRPRRLGPCDRHRGARTGRRRVARADRRRVRELASRRDPGVRLDDRRPGRRRVLPSRHHGREGDRCARVSPRSARRSSPRIGAEVAFP